MQAKVIQVVVLATLCVLAGCAPQSTRTRRTVGDHFRSQATPRVVEQVAPAYPAGFCGRGPGRAVVKVMALVRTDGTVENVRVLRSNPALDRAAVDCVKRWRFTPGRSEYGQPLKVWTTVDVHWDCKTRR